MIFSLFVRSKMQGLVRREDGFTLLELALVMAIVGILAGGGVFLAIKISQNEFRQETSSYLVEVKQALLVFANIKGRLPCADTDGDGLENAGKTGKGEPLATIPYRALGVKPLDAWRRPIRYEVNGDLITGPSSSCRELRKALDGSEPLADGPVYRDDPTGSGAVDTYPAAVIVSAGAISADGDGEPFDGTNATGNPRYIRTKPSDTFDDIATAIDASNLYDWIRSGNHCSFDVRFDNVSNPGTVYIFNRTLNKDTGWVNTGESQYVRFELDHNFELRTEPSGGGAIIASTPPTPYVVNPPVAATFSIP